MPNLIHCHECDKPTANSSGICDNCETSFIEGSQGKILSGMKQLESRLSHIEKYYNMNKIPMTSSGYSKLQDELKILVNTERPKIIESIAEARSHGDLSENAEYQYAKEQQTLIEGKIIDLESAIANAEIIDVSKLSGNEVKFGATVKIQDQDSGETSTYQIVGEYESDVKNKKISVTSPIARALIGKKKQDLVEVNSPKGIKIYNIISVKFI